MCRWLSIAKPHHRGHEPRHGCQSGREESEPRGHQREGPTNGQPPALQQFANLWKMAIVIVRNI